jgi:prophage antirepressor-like protein
VTLDGNPWFVAADVARVLTIKNITDTLKPPYIDPAERARFDLGAYPGNIVNIISESGLYKLIMRSDKPEAKRFQDWVMKEVLPGIRRTWPTAFHDCLS